MWIYARVCVLAVCSLFTVLTVASRLGRGSRISPEASTSSPAVTCQSAQLCLSAPPASSARSRGRCITPACQTTHSSPATLPLLAASPVFVVLVISLPAANKMPFSFFFLSSSFFHFNYRSTPLAAVVAAAAKPYDGTH